MHLGSNALSRLNDNRCGLSAIGAPKTPVSRNPLHKDDIEVRVSLSICFANSETELEDLALHNQSPSRLLIHIFVQGIFLRLPKVGHGLERRRTHHSDVRMVA